MKPLSMYLGYVIDKDDVHFESLLDDEDIFYGANSDKKIIESWIRDNYRIYGKLTISNDLVVDCTGNVIASGSFKTSLTNGLFHWGYVGGNFICNYCTKLKTLEGAPKKVGRCFDCGRCDKLETLQGAPEYVGEYFYCSDCRNLKSLEGAPKIVGTSFFCEHCIKLKTLKGAPESIGGGFICSDCENLESLEGAPEKIDANFECKRCKNLKITDSDRKKYKIYV